MPMTHRLLFVLVLAALVTPVAHAEDKPKDPPKEAKDKYAWQPLFDGKTLKGWKESGYGGGSGSSCGTGWSGSVNRSTGRSS